MIFQKTDTGAYPPTVEIEPTASETFVRGEALVVTAGKATKCGATTKPTLICEEDYVAPATGARSIRAHRVHPYLLYIADATASIASNAVDSVVTLDTTSTKITATAASGVATISQKLSDTKAIVRFV